MIAIKKPSKNQKKTRLASDQKTRKIGEVAKKPEKTNKKPG